MIWLKMSYNDPAPAWLSLVWGAIGTEDNVTRLLLVDDETRFREATRALLVERGFDCECADGAPAANELLGASSFDIVITDLQMEGNRHLEFVRSLGKIVPQPKVILLTAYPTLESAIQSVELPVTYYLLKPVPINDLVARIEEALAAGPKLPASALTEDDELASLTNREREVVELIAAGYRVANIAKRLFISQYTVRNHLKRIFSKLGVASQAELLEKLKPSLSQAPE